MDGVGIRHQLIENLRALRELLVVRTVLIQQSDGRTIAATGVTEFLQFPVHVTQLQQQHTFLDTAACGFLHTLLIGGDGIHRVFFRQVDISDGIIHLIQVFRIIVRTGHPSQFTDHLLRLSWCHHLRLGDTGIERQLVGRVQLHHLTIGLFCLSTMPQQLLQLSHEEPLTCFLFLTGLMTDYLPQVLHRLLVLLGVDIVVGECIVPCLHTLIVQRIPAHTTDHVFGIIEPAELRIALGEPGLRHTVDGGLCVIHTHHIVEGGGSLVELSLLELCLSHQQPGAPQEGVVLPASQPLTVLGCLPSVTLPLGSFLDTIALDTLLTLLDGSVVVRLSQVFIVFVRHRIEGQQLRIVIPVAALLLEVTFDEGLIAVEIGVISGIERLPPAQGGGILLRSTSAEHHQGDGEPQPDDRLPLTAAALLFFLSFLLHHTGNLTTAVGSRATGGAVALGHHGFVVLVAP